MPEPFGGPQLATLENTIRMQQQQNAKHPHPSPSTVPFPQNVILGGAQLTHEPQPSEPAD